MEKETVELQRPLRVTVEFDELMNLRMASALINALIGKTSKISGESSVDFEVMFAGELAVMLIALDESFEDNYCMTFRWTEGRTGVYIMVMPV